MRASLSIQNTFLSAALLLSAWVLLWQFNVQTSRTWLVPSSQTVQIQDQYYSLSPTQVSWLRGFTAQHFTAAELASRATVHEQIAVHLDSSFARVQERLPQFADWYYSLSGEYSRVAMALLSATSLSDGDFLARRAATILFPEQAWEDGLSALESASNASLLTAHRGASASWLAQVQAQLGAQRMPAPIRELQPSVPVLNLDTLNQNLSELAQISALDNRIAASSLGAAGLAGPALWRAVAARNAAASGRVLAAAGSRGGARLASAAGGAAVCAPGGPLAIACAAGAGIATWVATDWLLLQVDEAVNREALMAALEASLADLRSGLEQELMFAYDARLAALQEATQEQITQELRLQTAR